MPKNSTMIILDHTYLSLRFSKLAVGPLPSRMDIPKRKVVSMKIERTACTIISTSFNLHAKQDLQRNCHHNHHCVCHSRHPDQHHHHPHHVMMSSWWLTWSKKTFFAAHFRDVPGMPAISIHQLWSFIDHTFLEAHIEEVPWSAMEETNGQHPRAPRDVVASWNCHVIFVFPSNIAPT